MSAALAIRQDMLAELPRILNMEVRESAKIIAFNIGKTTRCVEGLRQGEHLGAGETLIALGRKYKPVRDYLTRLMNAETGDSGEDPSKVLSEIQRLLAGQVQR